MRIAAIALMFLWLSLPCWSNGDDGLVRSDLLKQQRLEKLQHLKPENMTLSEHFFLMLEKSMGEKSLQGQMGSGSIISPRAGFIDIGSGAAGGVRIGKQYFQSYLAISTNRYQDYEVVTGYRPLKRDFFLSPQQRDNPFEIPAIRQNEEGAFAYGDVHYRDLTQEDFYGSGMDTLESGHADYRLYELTLHGVEAYQWGHSLRLDVREGIYRPELGAGEDSLVPDIQSLYNENTAPGITDQPVFWHAGASFLVDRRDVPVNPHHGGAIALAIYRFDDKGANTFEFNRLTAGARYYVSLGSTTRVLALHFASAFSDAGNGHSIPFYLMPTLGGPYTLRGFADRRFRDNDMMHMTAEYRLETASWLELAFFTDAGKVFPRASDFNFRDLETSYGIGLRIKSVAGVLFSVEAAKSHEGAQVFFRVGPSF